MFLLIPMLSPPVAATVKYDRMGVRTNNTATFPLVAVLGPPTYPSYDPPNGYNKNCDTSGSIKFEVDCYIEDNNLSGSGSDHYVELNVQKISPKPYGDLLSTNTGIISLNAGQQNVPFPVTLSITTNYTIRGQPPPQYNEIFCAYVYAECEDKSSSITAYNTWYWYIVIT
jgi:hypothetical protein